MSDPGLGSDLPSLDQLMPSEDTIIVQLMHMSGEQFSLASWALAGAYTDARDQLTVLYGEPVNDIFPDAQEPSRNGADKT